MRYDRFFKESYVSLLSEDKPIYDLLRELNKEVVSQERIRSIAQSFFEESLDRLLILSFVLPSFFPAEDPLMQKVRSSLLRISRQEKTYVDIAVHMALLLLGDKRVEPVSVGTFPLGAKDPFADDIALPSPAEYLSLAVFAMVIFIESEDGEARKIAEGIAAWQQGLLTKEGTLSIGPWVKEETFSKSNFYVWTYLLLHTLLGNTPSVEALYKNIQGFSIELLETVDPLTYFIAEYLEERGWKGSLGIVPKKSLPQFEATLMENSNSTWAISLLGNRTGFGSFIKKQIQITSFGPHFFPLGERGNYGIQRGYNVLEKCTHEIKEGFSGWTQAVYIPEEGRLWLHIAIFPEKEGWRLQVKTESLALQRPFAFVFFVTAKSAQIGHKVKLLSSSLDRYVGQRDIIRFADGEENLLIEPQFATEQEVIPLAGMDYFWGADFLVAHTMSLDNQIYQWIIK